MFDVSGPAGNQPQWVPGQTVGPAQLNAAPFYLPNLIVVMVASVGVVVGSIGSWITFLALSRNAFGGDGTTYRSGPSRGLPCQWWTLSQLGNDDSQTGFDSSDGQTYAVIRPTDSSFHTQFCQPWQKVS
jgi:hypothetical protein